MLVMLAVLTKPDIRTDHVKLVDSFVDNERNRLISGDFKRQWAVPPIEVHRVVQAETRPDSIGETAQVLVGITG